jgi:hypothetical protein
MDKSTGAVGVTLPPRIRKQVEALATDLGVGSFHQCAVEFELQDGSLASTYIKIGRIKNVELEELAIALAALR